MGEKTLSWDGTTATGHALPDGTYVVTVCSREAGRLLPAEGLPRPGAAEASVRRALTPLIQLAEKRCCTLLMQRHLNKEVGGRALYRGLASIAFVAACRTALMVGRDPHEPGRCVLAPVRHALDTRPDLHRVVVELTEHTPVDDLDLLRRQCDDLRMRGALIALDDWLLHGR